MRVVPRLLIAAALAFGSGCASTDWIDRTLVTVDVTGSWYGAMLSSGSGGELRLELQQKGGYVTGYIRSEGRQGSWMTVSGPVEGSVAGDVFTFKDTRGSLTAELTVDGDEMKGIATVTTPFKVSLRRVDSSPRPRQ